jgi:hypothetical protein
MRAEDAIDELEQASFLVSLLPRELAENLLQPLGELCNGAISGAEAAVRGLEAAASLSESSGGEAADSEDALCPRRVSWISSTRPIAPNALSRVSC